MTDTKRPPLHVFRFHVRFREDALSGEPGGDVPLCGGAFAECSGLEASMEPKVIRSGGVNYGAAQRVGAVSFATVVLKRGMTSAPELWQWWQLVSGGGYAVRLAAEIDVLDGSGDRALTWRLRRALPVKFRAAPLDARSREVGIEELHLAHEGLQLMGA